MRNTNHNPVPAPRRKPAEANPPSLLDVPFAGCLRPRTAGGWANRKPIRSCGCSECNRIMSEHIRETLASAKALGLRCESPSRPYHAEPKAPKPRNSSLRTNIPAKVRHAIEALNAALLEYPPTPQQESRY